MTSSVIDQIARTVSNAPTRRQALRQVALGALTPLLVHLGRAEPAAAGCGGCPSKRPCCIKGKCRKKCAGKCCENCFVEIDGLTGQMIPGSKFCCTGGKGTVCRYKKKSEKDDRCCYPDERCVNHRCCGDNKLGAKRCGGKCCPIASCCNGKCCPAGKVCAGNPPTCLSVDRMPPNCVPGEQVVGGVCCKGDRICENGTVCCPYGQYCDKGSGQETCCPFNTLCNTYRNHRVRP